MINTQFNDTLNPQDFDIFVGLDVDKRSLSMSAFCHGGFLKSQKMPNSSEHLLNYVGRHFSDKRICFVYEAGPTGYGLYDDLIAADYKCLVVAPSQTPRASGERVKTNRIDSRKLAELLRGGQLKGIRVPLGNYRYLRHLAKLRHMYVKRLTATKLRIKSLFLMEGIAFPSAPPHGQWSKRVIEELKTLQCQAVIRFKLDLFLTEMEFQKHQVIASTRELRTFCKQDSEINRCIQLMTTIPGIGWIVAMHLLAAIGDWRLLRNNKEIGCFLGLTPIENSTGDTVSRGRISRMGDPAVRSKLIEGAWMAVQKDPELNAFYHRIRQRNSHGIGARKGIVAVTRKLTTRVYSVLKNQKPYELFLR
jgi:transposase